MRHTPGPWKTSLYRYANEIYGVWSLVDPFGQELIANVPTISMADNLRITHVQAEANARLIAAAPDLLAVLRIYVEAYATSTEFSKAHIWESAKRAIAKAEGVDNGTT